MPTLPDFPKFLEKLKKTLHLVFFTFPNFYLSTSEKNIGTGDSPGHRLPGGQSDHPVVGKIAHPKNN